VIKVLGWQGLLAKVKAWWGRTPPPLPPRWEPTFEPTVAQPHQLVAPVVLMPPPVVEQPTEPEAQSTRPNHRKHKPHKEHDFTYHYLRKDLADTIDSILGRLEHLHKAAREYYDIDIDNLENLWGCDFLLVDRDLGERMKGGDKWSAIDNASTSEMVEVIWPIDHAFVKLWDDDGGNVINLVRLTSVTAKQVRGKINKIYPKMLRMLLAIVSPEGVWTTVDYHLGLTKDAWVFIDNFEGIARKSRDKYRSVVDYVLPMILTARYEWHVAFGTIPGGPRVLIPTNPTACLQLFRNRDRDPNATRRAKLRHWVEEHWRENEEQGLAFVCAHLRGHTEFNWSGLACELFVSEYDLEKNELFKAQAKEWRSRRQHNRVRVHIKRKTNGPH